MAAIFMIIYEKLGLRFMVIFGHFMFDEFFLNFL